MNFHSKKIDSLFIQLKHSLKLEDLDERKNMKANFDGKMIKSVYVSTQICPVHKRVSGHSDQNLDYRTNSIWHHFFQCGDCRAKACLLRFISFWKHIFHSTPCRFKFLFPMWFLYVMRKNLLHMDEASLPPFLLFHNSS